jgi:quinol monooxygenase YgiN
VVTVGLLVTMTAKPGKEEELAAFLASALPLAQAEADTTAWFAIKIDSMTFGIFDVFPSAEGRQAQPEGPIAAALMGKADELLASPPDIKPIDVLAAKLRAARQTLGLRQTGGKRDGWIRSRVLDATGGKATSFGARLRPRRARGWAGRMPLRRTAGASSGCRPCRR